MASSIRLSADSSIESALFNQPRTACRTQAFQAGHERAMEKRLAQLQTALGNDEPMANSPTIQPTSANPIPRRSPLTSIILSSLVSALLGAGAMKLATANTPQPLPFVQQANAVSSAPPEPATAITPIAQPAPVAAITDEKHIEEVLRRWSSAWRQHDIGGYLEAYGTQFIPSDGSSREAWVAARTKKLSSKSAIELEIRELNMQRIAPDAFKVSFRQDYASGSYREVGRAKTLSLTREVGGWKIIREHQD